MPTRKFEVKGRVQGVGFRWFTRTQAINLGLSGTTRNMLNGDVEVVLEGSDKDLAKMKSLLKKGPPSSRVDEVDSREVKEDLGLGFEILPTSSE
ncbi:acylphosphatase [bacterium]|nr:acylphosphatase [bacterium]|tara:strand:+ start:5811 stop:6092 length:282 start_codon:yes stop_codon:yes gene_type:complete